MSAWDSIWNRMSRDERGAAAMAYLSAAEAHEAARESAVAVLACECRTRPRTVTRWPLEFRAARLARLKAWDPPFLAAVVATFQVECRRPLVTRFLGLAGVQNDDGALRPGLPLAPVPVERLEEAVATTRAEFSPRDVDLYLDALDAQRVPCLSGLAAARGRSDPPDAVACCLA